MTKTLSKAAAKQLDRDYAIEQLLTHYVKEGSKVFTSLRKVSSSGMTRHYSLFIVQGENIVNITYYAAHALGWRLSESTGSRAIVVNGAGMDMSFHLVSTLSAVLFHGQERADYILKEDKL